MSEDKEFKEFFREEAPMPDDLGNDPPPDDIVVPKPPEINGHPGGGGGGGAGSAWEGGGGHDWGGNGDGDGEEAPPDGEPQKEEPEPTIVWRTLITLTAKINADNIIKHPKTGKILTHKGKVIKGFEATYTYIIQAGLIEEYAYHLDCVLMDFIVNGKQYNGNEQNEALTDFFNAGFLKDDGYGTSELQLRTKWQQGHYPPWITTIYFKIIDVKAEKESVDNIALTKEFRDTVNMKIENGKMNFSKA